MQVRVHETAEVSPLAEVGAGTAVWHQAQIREGARVGEDCVIGKGAYIDLQVQIGNRVKVQNGAMVYRGVTVEDGAFIGPLACLANDRYPRAITPEGTRKIEGDWEVGRVVIRRGASIGASAVVLPDVEVGEHAMVAAGAVVSKDVPPQGLVMGNPARLVGYVCLCGRRLLEDPVGQWRCVNCGRDYRLEALPGSL
jgi:UDP-2-acetamido-3-amino-2,3-dideoxy-glucuronate N-acetyltransferase